jgi:hypothetical protein
MSSDQKRWKAWADALRQTMMSAHVGEVTKSIAEIWHETGTEKAASTLHSQRYWNACIVGQGSYSALSKAGFELSYTPNEAGQVEAVTLRLNASWRAILQRVLDRKK